MLTLLTVLMSLGHGAVFAAPAVDTAGDPALEARVQVVAAELRCLVCQNQSLADSHADLALDLKNQVREQLRAGRTPDEVVAYMTSRYGDFVLYRPPFKATTLLLWLGPALLLVGGLAGLWRAERIFPPALGADRAATLMAQWEHAVRQTVLE